MKLKDRTVGGLTFFVSETQWRPRAGASFLGIVDALINHRQANPQLTRRLGWSTSRQEVAAEVDEWNAAMFNATGRGNLVEMGEPAESFFGRAPQPTGGTWGTLSRLGNVAAGGETVVYWLGEGGKAVTPELAKSRAAVCAACPQNEARGGLLDFFTTKASAAIAAEIEKKNALKLITGHDENLGVCRACDCPLKLKVWCPAEVISEKLPERVKAALGAVADCWVKKELAL